MSCTLRVRLIPGGEVLSADVVETSGDGAFDRSVVAAVYKASPLPWPEDRDLAARFRDINFIFLLVYYALKVALYQVFTLVVA